MLWKCCTQYASKFGKLSSGHRTGKEMTYIPIFIPIPKKGNAKEYSNYRTVALISHASKVMLKILQARLLQYVNHELPDVQAGFRKGRGARDQMPTSVGSQKKQGNCRKKSTSASLTTLKSLTVWITTNWKILKEMGIPDHLTCLLRNLCGHQETTDEQLTGLKSGKEQDKAARCHPGYSTSMTIFCAK